MGSFLYNFYLSGVSLILKVYDLPRGMKRVIWKMNYWTIWWRLGTWIKWLNTVTSGSQESPVIAIFPSSTIAEHALNTMSRFKFKLCHSQHKKKKKAVTLMRIRTLLFRPRRRRFYVPLCPKTLFLFYIWFFIWITRRKLQVLMMIGLLS